MGWTEKITDKTKYIRIKMKFGLSNRISFYQRMIAFLESDIAIYDALSTIKKRLEENNDVRHEMLDEWLRTMRKGRSFGEAIKEWIPSSEYMLISAGESGGQIKKGLQEAVMLSLASEKMNKAIRMGLLLPTFLLLVLAGMIAGFDLFTAPVFISMVPPEKWPDGPKSLYTLSHLITTSWYIFVGIFVGIVTGVWSTMNTWTGKWRDIMDRFPPWSIYKSYQASSFLIGLASLLKAGVSFNDALKAMNKNASPWLQVHIHMMMARLRRGGVSLGETMNTGLFDRETAGDIVDYAGLSSFENAIYSIGGKMVENGVEKMNMKMGLLKNVMLILVASTLFWTYATSYQLQIFVSEKIQNSVQNK